MVVNRAVFYSKSSKNDPQLLNSLRVCHLQMKGKWPQLMIKVVKIEQEKKKEKREELERRKR